MRYAYKTLTVIGLTIMSVSAANLSEKFPLTTTAETYNKSNGGKSFGPFGTVFQSYTQTKLINEKLILADEKLAQSQTPWRYVVTMGCRIGDKTADQIVSDLSSLLPENERHRLAIVLNFNQRLTLDMPETPQFQWNTVIENEEKLKKQNIPIFLMYTPWAAWRQKDNLSPEASRETLIKELEKLKKRNKDAVLANMLEKDKTHSFPFGKMRTHMMKQASDFITNLGKDAHDKTIVGTYIHIQDSDYTQLTTTPTFLTASTTITATPLFKRYDQLLSHHHASMGTYPIFAGGAHVYNPDESIQEDLKKLQQTPAIKKTRGNIQASSYWTRFASETGNGVKHILGQYAPYGLYFHEPNTLMLYPSSFQVLNVDYKTFPVAFGPNSEMQELMRTAMKSATLDQQRLFMSFSAHTVLATSMKSGNKTFAIRNGGSFKKNTFNDWSEDDLVALRGMHQETLDANSWGNMVCTSFSSHAKGDNRKTMMDLFNLIDPYAIAKNGNGSFQENLFDVLIKYEDNLDTKALQETFSTLKTKYNKNHQGELMAFYILSAAWETGQFIRTMYWDYLSNPFDHDIESKTLAAAQQTLSQRFNNTFDHQHPLPNKHVLKLLGLEKVPPRISMRDTILIIVQESYRKNKTKKDTAKALGIGAPTLNNILKQNLSPVTLKKLAEKLDKNQELGGVKVTDPKVVKKLF